MSWDWLFRARHDDAASRPGEPLAEQVRERMEERLGLDLREVRVHHDEEAHDIARAENAEALTRGRDIYFAPGKYATEGDALLAHEIAHVAQQGNGGGDEGDALEHEADAVGSGSHAAHPAGHAAAGSVQRQKVPGTLDPTLLGGGMRLRMPYETFRVDDFDSDKSALKPPHHDVLDKAAESINAALVLFPDSFVSITGFTDATDTEAHNMKLGQQRADTVLEYLAQHGVPRTVMRAGSLGETALLVDTQKKEPRNRRVDIDLHRRNFFPPPKLGPSAVLSAPPVRLPFPTPFVPPKPYFDMRQPETPQNVDWMFTPEYDRLIKSLRLMKPESKSAADIFGEFGRRAAEKVGLPKWAQEKAANLARRIPGEGLKQIFDALSADQSLSGPTKDAIHQILEAIPEMK